MLSYILTSIIFFFFIVLDYRNVNVAILYKPTTTEPRLARMLMDAALKLAATPPLFAYCGSQLVC